MYPENQRRNQWTGKLVWNVSLLALALIFILLSHILMR